ncbi:hypothetical protein Q8A67_019437 [Cirrhinus molitorella]|uniref:Uncharacterized protein n=1 Tax=Cirrhinus molitorella TaxID=172907 RepID=A0AA88PCE0_9TELE|nr:hypothetical protein Q8A67_019437 [Cirrhinus molitorella]
MWSVVTFTPLLQYTNTLSLLVLNGTDFPGAHSPHRPPLSGPVQPISSSPVVCLPLSPTDPLAESVGTMSAAYSPLCGNRRLPTPTPACVTERREASESGRQMGEASIDEN